MNLLLFQGMRKDVMGLLSLYHVMYIHVAGIITQCIDLPHVHPCLDESSSLSLLSVPSNINLPGTLDCNLTLTLIPNLTQRHTRISLSLSPLLALEQSGQGSDRSGLCLQRSLLAFSVHRLSNPWDSQE